MDLADALLDPPAAAAPGRLQQARERLTVQAAARPSAWPAFGAAALAATAALSAAATVILAAPAIGAASDQVFPAVHRAP